MEREGISLSRFSFSEEKPIRTKLRLKTETPKKEKVKKEVIKQDYSDYYIGFFLSSYIKEGNEKLVSALQSWRLKDFGYGRGTFVFIPKASTKGVYSGLGGLFTFCCEVATRFLYEGLYKEMQESKAQLLSYAKLLMKGLEEDGKKQMRSISIRHDKSSDAFVYIPESELESYIKNIFSFYYDIVESKIKSGNAKFQEDGRNVFLLSKESLIANQYDPITEIDSIEAYVRWLKVWIYRSADKSFVLNAINDLKEELVSFIEDNNLSDRSHSEIKSALFMHITTLSTKIVSGTESEDSSSLYKSFDRILKMIVVKKGNFAYFLDIILGNMKSSGIEGLIQLEDIITDEIKVLLTEESFEINQTSTLFTEDIKAYDLLTGIIKLIKEYAPKESLKLLNGTLSLKTLLEISPEGVFSPVFQRVLDGITSIGVDKIIPKGVIYYINEYNNYFGSMVSSFMGEMNPEEVSSKRKYLMSIPTKSQLEDYSDHFDPMTVLDMIENYPETASLKKEKKLQSVVEVNNPPFTFSTSVGIMTSGELKNVHFPMSDEVYYYLSEIVYSVIKEVYKNQYNSIEEIIYDTNRERTKKAFDLMVEKGVFQNSMLGAFYFYRDKADTIIKSLYGNYYSIFFDWFFPMFGIKKATGKIPGGKEVNVFDFGIDLGVGGYVGSKENSDGTFKRWRGKGFGLIQKDILKEIDAFSRFPKEEDRIRFSKPIAKSYDFSMLTGSIRNASRNIPYLFIESLTVKYGFYYLLEKRELITKQLHRRLFLEAADGDGYTDFKKEHRDQFDDSLAEWEAFNNERYVSSLYAYTIVRADKKYRGDYQKFSKQLLEFIKNIPEILESRYLDDADEITAEFLDLAFISIQAFGFNGKAIKEAGISNNIPTYEDYSINDIENDIVTRLADEVYKDKNISITVKEDRKTIREELGSNIIEEDKQAIKNIKEKVKKKKELTIKEELKKEAERAKAAFMQSFAINEDTEETDLFNF